MILFVSIVIGILIIRQLYIITLRNKVSNKLQVPFVESKTGIPHILFYDIETTGLLPKYIDFESNIDECPRVVQIAWLVFDKDGFIIKKENLIIKQ